MASTSDQVDDQRTVEVDFGNLNIQNEAAPSASSTQTDGKSPAGSHTTTSNVAGDHDSVAAGFEEGKISASVQGLVDKRNEEAHKTLWEWDEKDQRWGPVYYKWNPAWKKKMIIINNITFEKLPKRSYSKRDVDRLKTSFGNLGFDISECYEDLNCIEMGNKVAAADKDGPIACLALVIMTHGRRNNELMGSVGSILLDTISEQLQANEGLRGTPKLLFIQACRGTSAEMNPRDIDGGDVAQESEQFIDYLPRAADILTAHSSQPNHVSHAGLNGTWFIQSLCKCLDLFGTTLDIAEILNRVAVMMSTIKISTSNVSDIILTASQLPSVVSNLRRKVDLSRPGARPANQSETRSAATT